jgi:ADP-ribose pyrophosphatase YjhB (NUDIX family)
MKPDYYYLETDGQVYLLRDKTQWRFPKTTRELPCRYKAVFPMPIGSSIVLYAHPILKHHPEHWFHKDDVIGRKDVDPIVQQAVNRSLPRGAAKVAIIEKGQVLMVMGRRGITKGMWNLPGGFIGYGEHPEESARREVMEELGTRVRLVRVLGIYAQTFKRTGGYMISFIYLGKRLSKKIRPHPEEIEQVCWMPLREALRLTKNPFAISGLRDYLKHTASV